MPIKGSSKHHDRKTLLHAAALQDHLSRVHTLPGQKAKPMPSMEPGAKLTLAQMLGLVPRPPQLLSQAEWDAVHAKSKQRVADECVICRDEFKDGAQVLLSCSHTFHQACLRNFERHARVKCCPLCRAEAYQQKCIHDAYEAYRHKCATRIQATVRGWLARRRVRELRRHHPPSDVRLKRQWAAERLQEESDRLLQGGAGGAGGDEHIDALFQELDASLAYSRQVADPIAARLQVIGLEQAAQEMEQAGGRALRQSLPIAETPASERISHADMNSSGISDQSTQPYHQRQQQQQQQQRRQPSGLSEAASLRQRAAVQQVSARISAPQQARNRQGATGNNSATTSGTAAGRPTTTQRSQHGYHSIRRRASSEASAANDTVDRTPDMNHPPGGLHTAAAAPTALVASRTGETAGSQQPDINIAALPALAPEPDWDAVLSRTCAREETECAICLSALIRSREAAGARHQGIAVLSCSHVFHVTCVTSFEAFELSRGGQPTCPVCRGTYMRRCFSAEVEAELPEA